MFNGRNALQDGQRHHARSWWQSCVSAPNSPIAGGSNPSLKTWPWKICTQQFGDCARQWKSLRSFFMLTKREKIEMWMLLDQAVCVLEDLRAGKTSPKEESVSDTIASIQKFRKRIRPKIVAVKRIGSTNLTVAEKSDSLPLQSVESEPYSSSSELLQAK